MEMEMEMKRIFLTLLCALALWNNASACPPMTVDRLNRMQADMMLSENGRYLLKRIPGVWAKEKGNTVQKRASYTLAFKLLKNGQLQQLWSMKGTFSRGYVSSDGISLLTIARLVDQRDRQYDPVIRIYRLGKKVKTYKIADLGLKQSMLQPLPCHEKRWVHQKQGSVSQNNNIVSIRTVDGKIHAFDLQRGVKIK